MGLLLALIVMNANGVYGRGDVDVEHFIHWLRTHECHRLYCEVTHERDKRGRIAVRVQAPDGESMFMRFKDKREDAVLVKLGEDTVDCRSTHPCRIVLYDQEVTIYK